MDSGGGRPLYTVFEEDHSEAMTLEHSPDKTQASMVEIST